MKNLVAGCAISALFACSPSVAEQVVTQTEPFDLDEVKDMSLLLLIDDDLDVTAGSAKVPGHFGLLAETTRWDPDAIVRRAGMASTRLDGGDVLWWGGGPFAPPRDIEPGSRQYEQWITSQLFALHGESYVERNDRQTEPRSVLTRVLQTESEHRLIDGNHLLVLISTGFDDVSPTTETALSAFRTGLDSTPAGVSVLLMTPTGLYDCSPYRHSFDDAGHQVTASLLGDSLIGWGDTCTYTFEGSGIEVVKKGVSGRQNALTVDLLHPPLDGTLQVTGLQGDEREPLEASQWTLQRERLQVGPPLSHFESIEVQYDWQVEP